MPQQVEIIHQGLRPLHTAVNFPFRGKPSVDYNAKQTPILDVLRFSNRAENRVEPNNNELVCSDDRFGNTEGRIARFGGSAGYVLGLLAINAHLQLGLTPETIVDSVVEASLGEFYFHSDEMAETTDYTIGCKHIGAPMIPENALKYGVNPEDVIQAVSHMRYLAQEMPDKVRMGVAFGDHGAPAVIINTGDTKLNHSDSGRKYYVLDVKREEAYLGVFYQSLSERIPQLARKGFDLEQFKKILDAQRNVTAEILAKGLPIFRVNLDGRIPFVESAGVV